MDTPLIFLRHGETEWSRDGRYQGRCDSPLTPYGEEQARQAAERLAGVDIAAIVSSPLRRAHLTASIVGKRLGLPIAVDERLPEIDYGDWEGLNQAAIKARWPELLRRWKTSPGGVVPPSGESLLDLRRRVRSFLRDCAGDRPILAVSHAGVIRIAILEARGEPLSSFRQVHVANGSLTAVGWRGMADANEIEPPPRSLYPGAGSGSGRS